MQIATRARREAKLIFLWTLSVAVIVIVSTLPRVAQPEQFHHFADSTRFFGIPNGLNVMSNLVFLIVGAWGCAQVHHSPVGVELRVIYYALFTGVMLTAFGSAFYHLAPDNARLVMDRLPMVIIFMSFLSAVIAEWISLKGGLILLPILLLTGIASVIWWRASEVYGAGDLRPYLVVQFYPVALILLILVLFASRSTARGLGTLLFVIGWYAVAKVLEGFDAAVYQATGFVSGHTLKHLAAGAATLWMVLFFNKRHRSQGAVKTAPKNN